MIDYIRLRHPNEPLTDDIPAADDLEASFMRQETLERLAAALTVLEPELRDIVVLHYYKGHSLTEIARLTGVSYGMIKVKHSRALKALRTKLE